jgi:eukaryotic-like serine/threonine-protein kinase
MRADRARKGPPRDPASPAGEMETPVQPGGRVAHYQVLAEIGRGGMGVIFRARDTRLDRDVALKCPWPHLASDTTVRERFLREARAASQLSHPHIVPIFEILRWGGLPWLAMELVEGSNLRSRIREQGALSLRQALTCAAGLADALRAAHEKGIIHRDINPNNILMRPDGWPLLTDFGLAHVFSVEEADSSASTGSTALTKPGHVMGTRGYMSPEQVLGKPLDPRSDIFSLGAVLYEMCTGRRAFAGEHTGSVNEAILGSEPVAMALIDSSLPAELDRIVRKALAKRATDRHKDARELHADLVALRRQVESADYAPSSRPALALPARAAWVTGVAAAAVVAAVAALLWPPKTPTAGLAGGTPRQITSDPGPETEPAISPDGGLIAYAAARGEGSDIWISDVRGGSRLRLTDDDATNQSPAWFPDGTAIAFVSDRRGKPSIWKVPRLGGAPVLVAEGGLNPAVAPDGRRIAFSRENEAGHYRLAVASLDDPGHSTWLTRAEEGEHHQVDPAWSPDGRSICYSDTRNLWLVAAGGGQPQRLTSDSAVDSEPAWTSDGRYVIFSSQREGTRALWRIAASGGRPERITFGTGPEGHPSVSSDGARLVYSTYSDDYDVVVVDRASGRSERIGSQLYDASPVFAPDGSALVFTSSRRGGLYDLWIQPLTGAGGAAAPRQLTEMPGTVSTPAYSPDGRWVAFKRELPAGREVWVVPAQGGLPIRVSDGKGRDMQPAWSPDATQLAYVSRRGAGSDLFAVSLADGRPVGPPRALTQGDTTDSLPAWSPDGRTIAYVKAMGDGAEIWTVPAAGGTATGPIVHVSQIGRVRWEKASGWLWFSAAAPREAARLLKVPPPPAGAVPVEALPAASFASAWSPGDFDLSSDGRLVAFTRQEVRGDVWLLESRRGAY